MTAPGTDVLPDAAAVAAMLRHHRISAFLVAEAELLDTWQLRRWLDLLTDDVIYQVPIRIHKEVAEDGNRVTGVRTDSFHMDENRASLEMRVERIETGFAWAEEPPTRIRHVIGNVRVDDPDGDGAVAVRSNVLLYHTRWDRPDYHVLAAERHDVLVDAPDTPLGWRLARRVAVLDTTVVPVLNMSWFL